MFIAINLIKDDFAIINSFPLIYENNTNDISIIDQIIGNTPFKNYINSNIHFSSFYKISLKLCFIPNNDSQFYYESSYQICDLFNILDIYSWEDFVIDEMKYLYNCAYKKECEITDIQQIYDLVKKKFPNKINKDTVINYISSAIREKYDYIDLDTIKFIQNKFKTNIKDD